MPTATLVVSGRPLSWPYFCHVARYWRPEDQTAFILAFPAAYMLCAELAVKNAVPAYRLADAWAAQPFWGAVVRHLWLRHGVFPVSPHLPRTIRDPLPHEVSLSDDGVLCVALRAWATPESELFPAVAAAARMRPRHAEVHLFPCARQPLGLLLRRLDRILSAIPKRPHVVVRRAGRSDRVYDCVRDWVAKKYGARAVCKLR